ncbi:MAG: carcinine hydrolase/isopenicillin-N N-acyltransferase family protein [Planctomycetota bacterium]
MKRAAALLLAIGCLAPAAAARDADRLQTLRAAAAPTVHEEIRAQARRDDLSEEQIWARTLLPETQAVAAATVLATGPRSATGEPLHVARYQLPPGVAASSRTWIEDRPDARPAELVGLAGAVGAWAGVNSAGISLTVSPMASAEPPTPNGLPLTVIVRDVLLQSGSLDEAVERLRTAPLLGAGRFLVADGERLDGRVVERTPTKTRVRGVDGGWLAALETDPEPECFLGACDADFPVLGAAERQQAEAIRQRLLDAPHWMRLGDVAGIVPGGGDEELVVTLRPTTRTLGRSVGGTPAAIGAGLDTVPAARLGPYAFPPRLVGEPKADLDAPAMDFPGSRRRIVTFDSPRPSGFAFNDRVPLEVWLPEDAEPRGVLIQLPSWKERSLVGHRGLALANARQGLATAILPLPYQNGREPPGVRAGVWTLSADLARTRQAALQGLADIAAASRILEMHFGLPPAKQAIGGVSLGAHAAATAIGLYPDRFVAAALVLAGGRVHEAFTRPNSVTGRIQRELAERAVEPLEAAALVAPLEPLTVAAPDRGIAVLLIAADADDVVSPDRARALAEAWGPSTRLVWLEGGHYAPARPDQAMKVLEEIPAWLLKAFPAP